MRTTPPENPQIWAEPRFPGQETRPVTHWGLAQAQVGADRGARQVLGAADRCRPDGHPAAGGVEGSEDSASGRRSGRVDGDAGPDRERSEPDVRHGQPPRDHAAQIEDQLKVQSINPELAKSLRDMDAKLQTVEFKLLVKSSTLSDDKYFVAGLQGLLEPDLAGRRGRHRRRRRSRRRRLPPDGHAGRCARAHREGPRRGAQ